MGKKQMPPNHEFSDRFLVGIPSGRLSYSFFWNYLIQWISQYPTMISIMESNRVDLNRSRIIQMAKDNHANVIFIDNDCLPVTSLKEITEILTEDFKKYDIVIAPSLSQDRQLMTNPVIKHNGKLQEIDEGSFTFAGISYDLIKNLKPLAQYGTVDGSTFPLYTAYTHQTSEDYQFCRKAKKMGYKVAAEPKIVIDHYKAVRLRYDWEAVAESLKEQGIED